MQKIFLQIPNLLGSTKSIVIHTISIITMFLLAFVGVEFDTILLIVTTVLTIEAIYLSLFLQLSMNQNSKDIEEIKQDADEIQHDLEEIQEDTEEIQKEIGEIQEDTEEIQKEVDELEEEINEDTDQDIITNKNLSDEITTLKSDIAEIKRLLLAK